MVIKLQPEQRSDIVGVLEPIQISHSVLENLTMLGYQEKEDVETKKGYLIIHQREIDKGFLAYYLPKNHVVDTPRKTSEETLIIGEYNQNTPSDLEHMANIIEESGLTKWMNGRDMGKDVLLLGSLTVVVPIMGAAIFLRERFWGYVGQLAQKYGQWETVGGMAALFAGIFVSEPVFNRVGRWIDRRRTSKISDDALNYRYGKIAEQKLLTEIDTAKIYETSTKQPYSQIPLDIFRELQAKAMEA